MKNFESQHFVNSDLKPNSGRSASFGVQVTWADGKARIIDAEKKQELGARVVDVAEILEDRLTFLMNAFESDDYGPALVLLSDAIEELKGVRNAEIF